MSQQDGPIFLSEEEVASRLADIDVVAVMAEALTAQARGSVHLPPESHLRWKTDAGDHARSLAMHAYIDGSRPLGGVKIINANPANIDIGLQRASGFTLLFDLDTARVRAIVPAQQISAARTAGVSTIAVDHCRAADSSRLAFIGCGPIAQWHARLLLSGGRQCDQISIFDHRRERATEFAEFCERLGSPITITIADTARHAVARSDVVIAATTATTAYVDSDWVRPGAVLVNVSLDDLSPKLLIGCDQLFVDDWDLIISDEHRLLGRLGRGGQICGPGQSIDGARPVDGSIADLVSHAVPGRSAETDIVVVNPFGMAVGDIAVGSAVIEGVGVR